MAPDSRITAEILTDNNVYLYYIGRVFKLYWPNPPYLKVAPVSFFVVFRMSTEVNSFHEFFLRANYLLPVRAGVHMFDVVYNNDIRDSPPVLFSSIVLLCWTLGVISLRGWVINHSS